ncbi:hypothetical protein AB1K70_25400 [Bremerella sp. JC770]|uniref:hypothetical protein n=1 Tax=Bremerella sp. JC770 TaxID=3232137 RepID=UPI003457B71D
MLTKLTMPISLLCACSYCHGQGITVDVSKELMVTDLAAVEHPGEALDPNGAFHVRTLFENMAPSGLGAKDAMLSFLGSFRDNDLDRQPREIDAVVLNNWKRWKLDGTPIPASDPLPSDEDWEVNWEKAPFRLLATVNRIDLRLNPAIGNAGEGRLVFGVTDAITGDQQLLTVIFEFVQPTGGDETKLKEVAEAWHALGQATSFDQQCVDSLKVIVEKFTSKNALPGSVNGSAIGQLRTNDIQTSFGSAANTGWELREWRLSPASGVLKPVTVKETPHHSLDNSETLAFLLERFGKKLNSQFPNGLLGMRAITGFNPDFPCTPVMVAIVEMPQQVTELTSFKSNQETSEARPSYHDS